MRAGETRAGVLDEAPEANGMNGNRPLPGNWVQVVVLLGAITVLYAAREVFIPLAIAVLLTFALAPVVSIIRKIGLPRTPAVIAAVMAAFLGFAAFSFLVVVQLQELAGQLPIYQSNILTKIRNLKESGTGGGLLSQLSQAVERVGRELATPEAAGPITAATPPDPVLVQIYSPELPIQMLSSMILPLVGPLATTGLVIVVVIFMLLEREDLRDRFIRLVGSGDLHRTTEALQDAGKRVGRYLLMQLVVNVTYGVPIALGLWLIGIPNAALWGALAIVLRFVPYIGPVVSMVLPLFLAVAVSPGWTMLLWVGALFVVMELISNNIIEPWLYGSRTGLSPLAIIIAAIFWTWLWGPVGLVMSTPLTVCLVVLGTHVPQFQFFEVLFGSEPVLDPEKRLYQRLLANDPDEATDQLEERLEEQTLPEIYGEIAIPALILADRDRLRGVMTDRHLATVAAAATTMTDNLFEAAPRREAAEGTEAAEATTDADDTAPAEPTAPIYCIGGRSALDDVSAVILAQMLTLGGAPASAVARAEWGRKQQLPAEAQGTVAIALLNEASLRSARFLARRFKRQWPGMRVGIVLWGSPFDVKAVIPEADFVAHDMSEARAALAPQSAPTSRPAADLKAG